MSNTPYPLFSVLGIEIEYMLVDKDTLNVCSKNDVLLSDLAGGKLVNEVTLGDITLSNELVMHVLELKNNGPRSIDSPIASHFQDTIDHLQPWLNAQNLILLPTGAHPWMNPLTETKRWPHGNCSIYQQYDRIFDCKGHGWSNLQSMHINLPFSNDEEFSALHNTVRLLLPLLPALAASSPILGSKPTSYLDTRLCYYEKNQQKIPSIAGKVIPPYICSKEEYQRDVLIPMYQDIAPYDPEKLLQEEWLNSRGAIPKFEYSAVEIRIVDTQECVNHDIAIAHVVQAILQHWCDLGHYPTPPNVSTPTLKAIYDKTIQQGFHVTLDDPALKATWELPNRVQTMRDAWSYFVTRVSSALTHTDQVALDHILTYGNLSERILRACDDQFTHKTLHRVYQQLGQCLLTNKPFTPK